MDNQLFQAKNTQLNAIAYIDYENIYELLRKSGHDLLEMNFFAVIQEKLAATGLNIMNIIVFSNFEKTGWQGKQQTFLRSLGLETRHASNNGKNSGDLELTVDAMRDLYKNPNIDVFVVVSSDRDIIPLLKAIKYENKLSYVISTQNGFNKTVAKYADFHEYIEDIFFLPGLAAARPDLAVLTPGAGPDTVSAIQIQRAKEVARCFYRSHIWRRASIAGNPVNLNGYLDVVIRVIERSRDEILEDFKLAHSMGLIAIYSDPDRGICIKEGPRREGVSE